MEVPPHCGGTVLCLLVGSLAYALVELPAPARQVVDLVRCRKLGLLGAYRVSAGECANGVLGKSVQCLSNFVSCRLAAGISNDGVGKYSFHGTPPMRGVTPYSNVSHFTRFYGSPQSQQALASVRRVQQDVQVVA